MKKKNVKGLVSKQWAKRAHEILTGNSPDIASILTKLFTMNSAETQNLKSIAARTRFNKGCDALSEALRYGWAFGHNDAQLTIKKPAVFKDDRRVRVLIPIAISTGHAIGQAQAAKISRTGKFRTTPEGQIDHTHATA